MRRDELRRAIELPGPPGGAAGRAAAGLGAGRRRRRRARRPAAALRRPARALAAARAAARCGTRTTSAAAASRERSRGWPRTPTSASSEAERRRARPMLLRLAGDDEEAEAFVRRRVPLDELELDRDEDAAASARRAHREPAADRRRGHGRGRPRGAAARVAAAAGLARGGRRGSPPPSPPDRRRPRVARLRARSRRALPRRPARRGARLGRRARPRAERARARVPRGRAGRRASARPSASAATNRRLRMLLAGVGVLLAVAVVAGVIADLRAPGRARARPQSPTPSGSAPRRSTRIASTDALLLANAGVALDDSVATRSNLLSALLRSPAALGVLNAATSSPRSSALSPDGGTLAVGDRDGTVLLFDTETRELIGEHEAPGPVWSVGFDPSGDSLAIAGERGRGALQGIPRDPRRGHRASCAPRRPLGPHPAAPGPGLQYFPAATYAPDGRSVVVTYSGGDVNRSLPLFLRRYDAGSAEPLGKAVRGREPLGQHSSADEPGRAPARFDGSGATYAIDAETLRVVRRYPMGVDSSAISADGDTLALEGTRRRPATARPRLGTGADPGGAQGPGIRPGGRELQPRRADPVDLGRERDGGPVGRAPGSRDRDPRRARGQRLEPGLQPRRQHPLHGGRRRDRDHLGRRRRPPSRAARSAPASAGFTRTRTRPRSPSARTGGRWRWRGSTAGSI